MSEDQSNHAESIDTASPRVGFAVAAIGCGLAVLAIEAFLRIAWISFLAEFKATSATPALPWWVEYIWWIVGLLGVLSVIGILVGLVGIAFGLIDLRRVETRGIALVGILVSLIAVGMCGYVIWELASIPAIVSIP